MPTDPAARTAAALALAGSLLIGLAAVPAAATGVAPPAVAGEAPFLGATWYADGSCSLSVGGSPSVGKTAIDADFDDVGARTLVHCDTEDGQRVTLLSRGGEALAVGRRVPLLSLDEIENGTDGSIAWLALAGEGFADDDVPRRFVLDGKVLIRSTPATLVAGAALHADKQPFAELTGRVEPPEAAPAAIVTR